jgi:ribonucleoside-diphosphate reductase alpha chain
MSALAYNFDQHGSPAARGVAGRSRTICGRVFGAALPAAGALARPPLPSDFRLDCARDALLTPFGKATLQDRYLMPGEDFQEMFARVSCAYADDVGHAQRLYDAMSRLWCAA